MHAPWLKPDQFTLSTSEPASPASTRLAGDPVRGQGLFARLACATCHSVKGRDEMVGPDLAAAWKGLGRAAILGSIQEPSRSMKAGFESYIIDTMNGEDYTGMIVSSDPDRIVVLLAGNVKRSLPRREVRSIRQSPISIMSTNLLDGVDEAGVDDLLGYLQSLTAR